MGRYEASVDRAIQYNGLLKPYRRRLLELPVKAGAMFPLDVVAIVGASADHNPGDNATVLIAHTLALRGYDLPTSQVYANEIRKTGPFDPNTVMLMPADMLVDLWGVMHGRLLAGTMIDPRSQPVLHSLLFDGSGAVERDCSEVSFACRSKMSDPQDGPFTEWQRRDEKSLTRDVAIFEYHRATGSRLQLVVPVWAYPEELRHERQDQET